MPTTRRWFLASVGAVTAALAAVAIGGHGSGASARRAGQRLRQPFAVRARAAPLPEHANAGSDGKPRRRFATRSESSRPRRCTSSATTAACPEIDPAAHTLMIHGLVDRPLVFSIDELKRLPAASRVLFIECSGNSSSEWLGAVGADRPADARPDELQRMDRRLAVDAAARVRRTGERVRGCSQKAPMRSGWREAFRSPRRWTTC